MSSPEDTDLTARLPYPTPTDQDSSPVDRTELVGEWVDAKPLANQEPQNNELPGHELSGHELPGHESQGHESREVSAAMLAEAQEAVARSPQTVQAQESEVPAEDGQAAPHLTAEEVERAGELVAKIDDIYRQRVVGQKELHDALVVTMMSGGHILVESVPGLAKTTAAQTLADAVSGSFRRIQCTPDLMPNDIVGTQIYNSQTGKFTTQLGPVHANFVLLDEINRSSAKTQSAMLEAMQEKQTTIGGKNYRLPAPFMVMATQNPIEEEGTYVLPEAQMDRFLMKTVISYPEPADELEVLELVDQGVFDEELEGQPLTLAELEELQSLTSRVYVHPAIKTYIVDLVNTTRGAGPNPLEGWNKYVRMGASPRGGIALMKVAQANALLAGRNYVIPADVKEMRYSVLQHRLVLTWDAMADGVSIPGLIDAVFEVVPVP